MTTTTTPIGSVRPIDRSEARALAETENRRALDQLRSLDDAEWSQPTDCPAWDVRATAGHVLGMMETFSSVRALVHGMRAGAKAAGDGPQIDGLTAVQVQERAGLTTAELVDRMAQAGPRQARWRNRFPGPLRLAPMKEDVGGKKETWRMAYLLDVILTRDTWMHRVDIARATGRELVLTAEHDGRLVADVVAEWARRHDRPFILELTGPAGGTFAGGDGGERLTLDAVDFCRTVSGREPDRATGLLATEVPF